MSSIFGGSKQSSTSSSSNQAYPQLSAALTPEVNNGVAANNTLSGLLGGQGQAGSDAAFAQFRNGTGYQFGLNQGEDAVTQNAATKGLLNSGSTARALDTYGQNYANSQYQNFTNLLGQQQQTGNQAAGIIGSTGAKSNSSSSGSSNGSVFGSGGIGGLFGGVLSGGLPH